MSKKISRNSKKIENGHSISKTLKKTFSSVEIIKFSSANQQRFLTVNGLVSPLLAKPMLRSALVSLRLGFINLQVLILQYVNVKLTGQNVKIMPSQNAYSTNKQQSQSHRWIKTTGHIFNTKSKLLKCQTKNDQSKLVLIQLTGMASRKAQATNRWNKMKKYQSLKYSNKSSNKINRKFS